MQKTVQRSLNSSVMKHLNIGFLPAAPPRQAPGGDHNIARSGSPKVTLEAQTVPGQTRQTRGEMGYHHGVTVGDAPNLPYKSYETKTPIHPGMTKKQVADTAKAPSASAILHNASNLGRKA